MTAKATEGLELAIACARAADEIQAEDIRVWDLQGISTVTDFIVVCCGNSMPHLRAVMRDVEKDVFEWTGVRPVNAEGKADSRWVVLDYIDVMVHVMHGELRELYGLERLWGDAKEVAWRVAGSGTGAAALGGKTALARKPEVVRKAAGVTKAVVVKPAAAKKAATKASKKTTSKKVAARKAPAKKAAKKEVKKRASRG